MWRWQREKWHPETAPRTRGRTGRSEEPSMTKPIVLIHGAWHGAWAFDRVAQPLTARGFDVHTIDLPLDGVRNDVDAARGVIEENPGAVVLGHSYGGLVITHAAAGLPVSHLVYLAAMMPDSGEDVLATASESRQNDLSSAFRPQPDGRVIVDPELSVGVFYHDCDPVDAEQAVARLRPMLMADFPHLDDPAWKSIPSTYVICSSDRALNPKAQRAFAKRATHQHEWDVAHSPFLNKPELAVELLAELAS